MLFTAIARPTPTLPRPVRVLATALLVVMPGLCWHGSHALGATTVPWHADLPTAQRASQLSGRPVLAIFTASWMPTAAAIDRTALASDEAVALVAACYEPVCVDVDAHPEATRHAGVSRVPTVCVLTADNRLLSKFELPETPAEFVAAAARAAQDAAFAAATTQPLPRGVAVEHAPGSLTRLAGRGSPFGGQEGYDTRPAAPGQARGLVPPGGRAITAVAAKVRMLSDFASTDCPPTVAGDAIAASFRETSLQQPAAPATHGIASSSAPSPIPADATALAAQSIGTADVPSAPVDADPLPPAESLAGSTPAGPLGIEAGATTPPATQSNAAAPWLGMPQAAPAIAPATPARPPLDAPPGAHVAAAPAEKATAIEPRPSTAEKVGAETAASAPSTPAATGSSLLATLQKPFGMFARPAAPAAAGPAAPPAQRSAAGTSPSPEKTATAAPAEPDPYGSMPVGLEGYCPVMLAERGVWVEGRAQWGVRHRGRTYLFAGEQQQRAFLADPDRYAPALSGDDPVLAFDSGKCTPGQRRYGVTYQSRMYLFSSSETRDTFAANPQRYTAGTFVAESRGSSPAGGSVIR